MEFAPDPVRAIKLTGRVLLTAVEIPTGAVLDRSVITIRPNPTIKADQKELQLLTGFQDGDLSATAGWPRQPLSFGVAQGLWGRCPRGCGQCMGDLRRSPLRFERHPRANQEVIA